MEFEWDPDKSAANRKKHGIDFVEAQALWQDVLRVEVPALTIDEPRWLVVGQINGKHWSAVVTYREQRPGSSRSAVPGTRRWRSMKADEFDARFDRGEDVTSALDFAAAQRPGTEQRRVNVDFPTWMVESLDREARRLGVTRQSVIKVWLADRLEHGRTPAT